MGISLYIDKVKLAVLKRLGKTKKSGRTYAAWAAKGHLKEPLVTFLIQSHDKSLQVCHVLPKLRTFPHSEIVVIDDGSSLEHTARLARELTGANEFLVRANDLYENITYDKCLRFCNGRYVALLPIPTWPYWVALTGARYTSSARRTERGRTRARAWC